MKPLMACNPTIHIKNMYTHTQDLGFAVTKWTLPLFAMFTNAAHFTSSVHDQHCDWIPDWRTVTMS